MKITISDITAKWIIFSLLKKKDTKSAKWNIFSQAQHTLQNYRTWRHFHRQKRGENELIRPQSRSAALISVRLPLWRECRRQLMMGMIDVRMSYYFSLATGKLEGAASETRPEFTCGFGLSTLLVRHLFLQSQNGETRKKHFSIYISGISIRLRFFFFF